MKKKLLALFLATVMATSSFAGIGNANAGVVQAAETRAVTMGSSIASTMLDHSLRDNTWLFTGGESVQGGFEQTRGIRNYIGQFEEYIRWTVGGGSAVNGRQRFTFNTAKTGQTLENIVADFDARVATFKTKAVVYMVSAEDYMQGEAKLEAFSGALKSFIDKSLALKDNKAFVIIQKPFAVNDTAANANIEKYCAAVDSVIAAYADNDNAYARILVVDHYAKTKNDTDFKANKLENDKLNAQGHLAISKQFAETVVNFSGSGYPKADVRLNRVELDMPEEFLDVQPVAAATEDSLTVGIPAVDGVTSWKYELDMEGTKISGTADGSAFEIKGLAKGKSYVLKVQSADGEKQLVTTMGVTANGNVSAKYAQELDSKQQKIAAMVNDKTKPMTWLFMGDSITHGSGLTYGYDGIAQAFEEFVKEGLGRKDDIVLNTAVANANTVTTIQELDQRLTNYNPDVISLMIGTNDCSSRVPEVTVDVFRQNMKTILDTMKNNYPNAVIILRSMTPVFNDGNREPYMPSYMNVVKELAAEYDTIYVDQYTALKEATDTFSGWLPKSMFTDNLHPEANGHRVMTNQFIKALGLWTQDVPMTNVFYSMGVVEEASEVIPSFSTAPGQIRVSRDSLKAASGLSIGSVTLKATSKATAQTYEVTTIAGEEAVLTDLPYGDYEVIVSSYLRNTAKNVTFKAADVTVSDETTVSITLGMDETYVEERDKAPVISKQPDATIATVVNEEKASENTLAIHDFVSSVGSSLDSFSTAANDSLDLSDMEIVLTTGASADSFKAKHVATGKYLTKTAKAYVELADNADAAANQLKFAPTTADGKTTFKICRASDNSRYIVFATSAMRFDTMGSVISWNAGTYELTLLEKQATVSESDVIPGYTPASSITSGNTYVIAHIFKDTDGTEKAIVLYPEGADGAGQTKLAVETVSEGGFELVITAVDQGTTEAVVDGVTYKITVMEKVLTPDDASRDIPVSVLKATAGNEEALSGSNTAEGPARFVLDDNTATMWHTDWDGSSRDTHWIQFELSDSYVVDGLRYLPRNNSVNGVVTKYKILTSNDGEAWDEATSGNWSSDGEWKKASFDGENVKYVRLKVEEAGSTNAKLFASALEIRLTGKKAEAVVTPTPEVTVEPTEEPTVEPTAEPTTEPTVEPTPEVTPTVEPTVEPTEEPTVEPTETPDDKKTVTEIFTDVYDDWYTNYVQYVYDNGLMTGIKGTTEFQPNANITKAQVAQVLYNMEEQPEVESKAVFTELTDVYEGEWYAAAVAWAYDTGVVTGDLNAKKFFPNADVTREQLALMMFRYAQFKEYDTSATSDLAGLINAENVNNWAADGVKWAVGAGLISGIEKNGVKDLAPQGNASRAQVAAILQRFCENIVE